MVARSTDGHKTNASLGAEHLDGDGEEILSGLVIRLWVLLDILGEPTVKLGLESMLLKEAGAPWRSGFSCCVSGLSRDHRETPRGQYRRFPSSFLL